MPTNDRPVSLTGIKPTGAATLGNYLGMIRPALALTDEYRVHYFIADYHALTTVHDARELRELTYDLAATWLALGLEPGDDATLYRQSDVAEIFEIAWILSCFTPKGLLNRAHAYKAATEANECSGATPDDGISAGLFNYPVLMASDILAFDTDVVPVGLDQKQHIEIARDIADVINQTYAPVIKLPAPRIEEQVQTIPGLDGRKMSKSYGNTIPLFLEPTKLRKTVRRIVTDSRRPEEPKDPEGDTLFTLYGAVAPAEDTEQLRQRYLEGGTGYGEVKDDLADRLIALFEEPRQRYEELMADRSHIDQVLDDGAERARAVAGGVRDRLRKTVGIAR
ncbi:MAG: tryptophan--tRNA ligase [Thermoleophilia bacterium]|nr:tryptophan--tRNA ligase [Thermoleophilia bacterium]